MKKLKFSSIFLICCLFVTLFTPSAALAIADPTVNAEAVYLLDTGTQQVLYAKNADQKVEPRHLPHIVTVLLTLDAIENGTLTRLDPIAVPEDFDSSFADNAVRSGFAAGETVILENLLYCAVLEYSDDACQLLAGTVADSASAFVGQMNAYVEALGCTNTRFAAPGNYSGEEPHHTTAKDAALILQKALSHPGFCALAAAETYSLPETDKNSGRLLETNTAFTSEQSPSYYSSAEFSSVSADETAIFATAVNGNIPLLTVVFGAESGECYAAAAAAFDWVFLNFQYSSILTTLDVVTEVEVAMANEGELLKLCPDHAIALLTPRNETVDFNVQYTYNSEQLVAPIEKDTVLGEVTVLQDGVVCSSAKLIAKNEVSRSQSQFILSYLRSTLLRPATLIVLVVVLALLGLYIWSVVRYRKRRRAYLAYMREQDAAAQNSDKQE